MRVSTFACKFLPTMTDLKSRRGDVLRAKRMMKREGGKAPDCVLLAAGSHNGQNRGGKDATAAVSGHSGLL